MEHPRNSSIKKSACDVNMMIGTEGILALRTRAASMRFMKGIESIENYEIAELFQLPLARRQHLRRPHTRFHVTIADRFPVTIDASLRVLRVEPDLC